MIVSHPTEYLPAFALGCLEHEEADEVRNHLLTCMSCRADLSSLEEVSSLLAYAAPQVHPSPALKHKLLIPHDSLTGYAWFERLLNHFPRLVPAASLMAVILTVIFGASNLILWHQTKTPELFEEFAEYPFVLLKGTEVMPGAEGRLIADLNSKQGLLLVDSLSPLKNTSQYQLWLIRNGERTSGAVFSVNGHGMACVLVSSKRPLTDYDSFGITIEPYGGSSGPSGKKVLEGKMLL